MIHIPIVYCASADEQAIYARALDDLLASAAGPENADVQTTCVDDLNAMIEAEAGTIHLISLLPFVDMLDLPWSDIEASVEMAFDAFANSGDPVLVTTVFRCVVDRGTADGHARLVRIRRLNLLATELSRKYGAIVVDLDRRLSDIGGAALGCDYRLQGAVAVDLAGEELAQAIVANGLDEILSFEAQGRIKTAIEARRSNILDRAELSPTDVMALGRGRHRQRVTVNTDAVSESHVGWLASQVMSGRMGIGEAARRLVLAIRRRGLRECVGLIVSAVNQLTGHRKQAM